jgi:tetratricopeptide (TPR) repeat protein
MARVEKTTDLEDLHLRGIHCALVKNLPAAIDLFNRALSIEPDNAYVLFNRANAYFEQGQLAQALGDLEVALQAEPFNALGLLTKGNVLRAMDQPEQALICFDEAIALKPDFHEAWNNRGVVLKALGRTEDALLSYAEAISHQPDDADAHNNLGILLMDAGNLAHAIPCFKAAIAWKPLTAETYNNLGNAFNLLHHYADALNNFDNAIRLKPTYAEAYSNRASALEGLMRLDEAIESCEIAIGLNDQLAVTFNKLGVMLKEKGAFHQSLEMLLHALDLQPDYLDAAINQGNVLAALRRFDESRRCFDQVLFVDPSNQLAKWNKSILCLLMGDYQTGWPLYETGWSIEIRGISVDFGKPLWLGDWSLAGQTILLHAEQGLGDTIQFCRYAKHVKNMGARVLLEVPKALMSLLSELEGVDVLIEAGTPRPAFDCHSPLMSLPLAFKTELESIPSPTAYLKADPIKVALWSDRLGDRQKLKVGVVWNGGCRPNLSRAWWVNQRRNISLAFFATSLHAVDVDFYSLQKGDPAESEIRGQELHYWPQGNFFNHSDALQDFSDTAALIANLDLVISVDTSTAHLAAALGKPTWILTRYDTCWRWLVDRQDSPWYESVKLYRQGEDRDWTKTLTRVAADLAVY